jgi:rhamnopyranosyl-N-acetylglucosaminyl-diphospho-decaprenol beta-1,3/1,4-galactofuranosyltransferase
MSVLAVVLTYDAPDALDRCLAAIDRQTTPPSRVLVIDNGGSTHAHAGERKVSTDVLRLDVNGGPAGGHAAGVRRFLDSPFDVAWIMDDDCIPEPECLERLVTRHAQAPEGRLVFPLWIDAASGEGTFRPAWCGFVIDRHAVERLGIPRADFVWWAEDTEYLQWRVHAAGIQVEEERGARVEHRRVRWVSSRPVWKVYYEVRNTVFFRLYVQRRPFTRFRRMVRTLGKLFGQIVTREDRKVAKLGAYMRGLLDGLTGRLGLRMPLR